MFNKGKKNALMTSSIFSPQLGQVGPSAPDKMTKFLSNNYCFRWRVPNGVLGPRFGLPLSPSSLLTIFSHTYVTTFSHV